MARILLIKCSGFDVFPYAIAHPMGIMYLSAYLKREGGHETGIIDTRLKLLKPDEVVRRAREFGPDVIGLSSLLLEAVSFHDNAAALRAALPDVPLVAGGPYASSCPERMLQDENILCAAVGEGENTTLELVDTLLNGGDISQVAGLAVRENGAVRRTEPREFIQDVDALPFPDWDALDLPAYRHVHRFSNLGPGRFMPLFTSRSCPWNCIYCHNIFGKKFRARSPENVLSEIRTLIHDHGIRDFEFIDDCFNLDRDRAEAICDLIIDSGEKLRLSFPNGVRSDRLDRDLLKKLRRAGTVYMSLAIESGSGRMQKLMRKNLDLEKARQAITDAAGQGIFCNGFFMLGFPTETEQELRSTVDFAVKSRLHSASFFIVKPMPGTRLYEMVFPDALPGQIPDFDDYSYFKVALKSTDIDGEQLQSIFSSAFRRFYMNPVRVLRILLTYPDKSFLFQSFLHVMTRIMRPKEKK